MERTLIKNHLKPKRSSGYTLKAKEIYRIKEVEKENEKKIQKLGEELEYLKKVDPYYYRIEKPEFDKVHIYHKYGGQADKVAEMISELPPDYKPTADAEAKYRKKLRLREE